MNHQDLKTLGYYANSAYATHNKDAMNIDQFFKVRDYIKHNKNAASFMKNLKAKNQGMLAR